MRARHHQEGGETDCGKSCGRMHMNLFVGQWEIFIEMMLKMHANNTCI